MLLLELERTVVETARCLSSSDKRLRRRPSLCRRAAGTFHVMGLRVSESKED